MSEHTQVILNALQNARGDDHIRARMAFKGRTPEQMQQQYAQSGETCAAILEGYEQRVAKIDAAIAHVKASGL